MPVATRRRVEPEPEDHELVVPERLRPPQYVEDWLSDDDTFTHADPYTTAVRRFNQAYREWANANDVHVWGSRPRWRDRPADR